MLLSLVGLAVVVVVGSGTVIGCGIGALISAAAAAVSAGISVSVQSDVNSYQSRYSKHNLFGGPDCRGPKSSIFDTALRISCSRAS